MSQPSIVRGIQNNRYRMVTEINKMFDRMVQLAEEPKLEPQPVHEQTFSLNNDGMDITIKVTVRDYSVPIPEADIDETEDLLEDIRHFLKRRKK